MFDPPVDAPGRAGRAVGPERRLPGCVLDGDLLVAAVADERELAPGHREGALPEHAVLARAAIERHDSALAQAEELLVVRHPDVVGLRPVEHRGLEGALRYRVADPPLQVLVVREI